MIIETIKEVGEKASSAGMAAATETLGQEIKAWSGNHGKIPGFYKIITYSGDDHRERRNQIFIPKIVEQMKILLPRVEKTLERLNLPSGKYAFGDSISLVDLNCL